MVFFSDGKSLFPAGERSQISRGRKIHSLHHPGKGCTPSGVQKERVAVTPGTTQSWSENFIDQ
ncbi:MAG: hypothetical protein LIP06_05315 [Tannerellaceae bacterium]|nr:hypothetical protein [Tannerellaceae bacterium]